MTTPPLLDGGGTHIITIGAFLAPMPPGEHVVRIRGGYFGRGIRDTYGIGFLTLDLSYRVVVAGPATPAAAVPVRRGRLPCPTLGGLHRWCDRDRGGRAVTRAAPATTYATILPRAYYLSPATFESEVERVFFRQWTFVAHESELPGPGDFLVEEIVGESIIVVRDGTGEVHAFFNVCRHRGYRFCEQPRGTRPASPAPTTAGATGRMATCATCPDRPTASPSTTRSGVSSRPTSSVGTDSSSSAR